MKYLRLWLAILIFSIFADFAFAQKESDQPALEDAREGFISVEGGKVWYQIVGSVDAVPLLIIHGGPGYPHDYLEPLAKLAEERPVIFYDQLGCGKSERASDSSLWKMERFVKELAQLRAALDLDQVHILGHSWGSMLATDYLLTKPTGVKSVILAGPCLSVQRWVEDINKWLKAFPDSIQSVIRKGEQEGSIDSEEYQAAIALFYSHHLCRKVPWPEYLLRTIDGMGEDVYTIMWGLSEFVCTGNLKAYERADRLSEIAVPALFTSGRYDETRPETAKWYQSLLPGSELVIFEQSSHCPHIEEEEAYLQTISDFLNRVEESSGSKE